MYETDNLKNAIQSCLSKVRSGKQFPVIWMVEEIVTAMAKLTDALELNWEDISFNIASGVCRK